SAAARVHVKLNWVESVDLEKQGTKLLEDADGILVPGGFGDRGIEGKIAATRFAAENEIPFQGVCLGFQLATIGFARAVLGLKGANSSEFDPKTPHPVVDLLPEQHAVKGKGRRCASGHIRSIWTRSPRPPSSTGPRRSTNGTDTGTKSTPGTSPNWRTRACDTSAGRTTGGAWKSWH